MKNKITNISKFIKPSIPLIFIGICIYYGIFEDVNWVKYFFVSYTWFNLFISLILFIMDNMDNKNVSKTERFTLYKDNKNLIHFYNCVYGIGYPIIILSLLSQKFWSTSFVWAFLFMLDFTGRIIKETYFKQQLHKQEINGRGIIKI